MQIKYIVDIKRIVYYNIIVNYDGQYMVKKKIVFFRVGLKLIFNKFYIFQQYKKSKYYVLSKRIMQ